MAAHGDHLERSQHLSASPAAASSGVTYVRTVAPSRARQEDGRILGRRRERERIDQLLSGVREGRGGALALTGEPGIGKTVLLQYAQGRAAGMLVLRYQTVEMFDLPFAGLDELLRPVLGRVDRIPDIQAAALRGALALGPPVPDANFAVCQGVLSLLRDVSSEAPVLVVVDDAQWLDPSSAEAFMFVARRLEGSRIALLLAVRSTDDRPREWTIVDRIELTGLDPDSSLALLRATGVAVAESVAERLHAASSGNPLALLEVADQLSEAQLTGSDPIDDPPPAGSTADRTYVHLIEGLSAPAQLCLLLASAAGSAPPDVIERAMTLLDLGPVALAEAEGSKLLKVRAGRYQLRHPLVRSVVYHRAGRSADRRSAHRALAEAMRGNPSMGYERAWHLAAAAWGPDREAAAALEAAATTARERSSYSTASQAFETSARLTEDAEERSRRLKEAAATAHLAGRGDRADRAVALLEEAGRITRQPRRLGEIEHLRGQIEMWRGHPLHAGGILTSAVEAMGAELDPEHRALMLADAAAAHCLGGMVDEGVRLAQRAYDIGQDLGGAAAAITLTCLTVALIMRGRANLARPLLPRYGAFSIGQIQAWGVNRLTSIAGPIWTWVEDYEVADAQTLRAVEEARTSEALSLLPFLLVLRADLNFRTGDWRASWEAARESAELSQELLQPSQLVYALLNEARVEAAQGREDECRAHVRQALEFSEQYDLEATAGYAVIALGLLELGLGRADEALEHLEVIARASELLQLEEPNLLRWQPDYIEALMRSGRRSEAVHAAAVLTEQAERTGGRWARGAAAEGAGLVTTGPEAVDHFRRALTLIDQTIAPFDRGRVQLNLARELRQQRRHLEARPALREAISTFERLDAKPWLEQAELELRLTGGRRARRVQEGQSEALTAGEMAVAALLVAGRSNKEIARSLGISVRTVESHLSAMYDKFGIHSRTQLVLRMGADPGGSGQE